MKDQVGELNVSLKEISSHELICSSCAQWLDGEFIELCVSDNGPGIEETVIKHIFEAFFTTKAVGEGTGLGLSTVCNMVHEAQGHIIVESKTTEPNRGTAFRLLFPRC
jgi:signal transduction histidine kinase